MAIRSWLAVAGFLLGATCALGQPSAVSLYVATNGNDAWSGKLAEPNAEKTDGPFATLERARDEVRSLKIQNQKSKIQNGATVFVRSGVYFFQKPLTLGSEDSGTEKGPILYGACSGEKVILKGSRPVSGWKPYRGNIHQADLSGLDLGGKRFWQVFHNEKRQTLARYPNVDPKHPRSGGFLYLTGSLDKDTLAPLQYAPWKLRETGSKTALQYNPKRLDPGKWSRPTEVRVHVWSWLNWNRSIVPIKSIDREKNRIVLQKPASYALMEGNRFFVENALEELDAPGEWYYDDAAKRLYFWPPDNQNPEGKVSVPVLPTLVEFQGDAQKKAFVSHVRLQGFALGETHDALVTLRAAAYCAVAACTMTNCGGTAAQMSDRSHHNQVLGCDIAHVGGSAVSLSDVRDWTHSLQDRISFNLISNNHVHDVGENGHAWGAITIGPGCGGNASHDNVISHNLVHDTPRQGISFNGFRNVVEYNHVHHTNQEQSDTGAIGMGSRDIYERGSIIRHNYVHDTGGYNMLRPGVWEYPHYCWGIYLDDYTSGVHVYGNIAVRTYLGGVMVHGGQDNVIENNIIVDGFSQQIHYSPIDSLTSGRTPGHPDTGEWLMKGTKLIGNIFCYSGDESFWIKGRKWEQILAESDRNLIWHRGKPIAINLDKVSPEASWAEWQKMGFDKNSMIADPMFAAPEKDDYRLRPESPAFKLGFTPIPVEEIGLHESADRASWPVADDCWREEHIVYPEGKPADWPPPPPRPARKVDRKEVPRLMAMRVSAPPTVDGKVDAPEWNWDAPGTKATIQDLSLFDGNGKQPSHALACFDHEALYVALVNHVSNSKDLLRQGGEWGKHDAAEICIQDASGATPGPVFVVQGYPSGKCESVANGGAPAEAVEKLGRSVQYAATISDGKWCGEWKIPFAALGIDAQKAGRILLNIGVLKAAEKEWIAWAATGGAPWQLRHAGQLILAED